MSTDKVTLITDDLLSEWITKHDHLKELLTIKRNAEVILDDDTVNNWMIHPDKTRNYTEEEVKQAAEDFNNAVKETDDIISNL